MLHKLISPSSLLSIWKPAEALHTSALYIPTAPSSSPQLHPAVRSTAALWLTPLLQSPTFCCTVAFLWQSIFMMSPPPTAMIVAMEIRRSAPDCCLGERVLELTTDREHVFVCARRGVHLCTRFIFNCYLQSAYWAQSVIREAQHEVNSWDSFTSVLMDFLCLCLSLLPSLSLHVAATSTTMNHTILQSPAAAV